MSTSVLQVRKSITFIVALFSATIMGVSLAAFVEYYLGEIDFTIPATYILIPSLLILAFLSILIHELGHALGARLGKFRLVLLVAGPLRIMKKAGRLEFGLNRMLHLSGGLTLSVPDAKPVDRLGLLCYLAGGFVASFIACGIFAIMVSGMSQLNDQHPFADYLTFFAVCGAFFNGGIGLITCLPLSTKGADNDGRLLIDLLQCGEKSEIKMLVQSLSAEAIAGVRPRDWNAEQVENLLLLAKGHESHVVVMSKLMAYYHFIDKKDFDAAGQCAEWMSQTVTQCPNHLQHSLWVELAFFELWKPGGDGAVARNYMEQAKKKFIEKQTWARVEAAVLYMEDRYGEAIDRASEGILFADSGLLQAGLVDAEIAWMENIIGDSSARLVQFI